MAGTGALTFDAIRNKALASANISLSTTSFSQWPEFLYFVKKLGPLATFFLPTAILDCFIDPESTNPVYFYEIVSVLLFKIVLTYSSDQEKLCLDLPVI